MNLSSKNIYFDYQELTKQKLKHAEETAKTAIIAQERMANRCADAEALVDTLGSQVQRLNAEVLKKTETQKALNQQLSRSNQRIDELKVEIENLQNMFSLLKFRENAFCKQKKAQRS